jgi:hypothetical protein
MVSETIRERFLRDPLPVRLGGLAADLARIASFSENPVNHRAVAGLLEEGKWFAEWAAPDAPLATQAVLAETQLALASWERGWLNGSPVPTMRDDAQRKSDELLQLAGLV